MLIVIGIVAGFLALVMYTETDWCYGSADYRRTMAGLAWLMAVIAVGSFTAALI